MAGLAAFGTTLSKGTGTPVAIANITSIEGPGFSTEMLDVTAHDSGDGYRERVPSFLDVGEISLRLNWDPSDVTHVGTGSLHDDWEDKAEDTYTITFPDTGATTLSGLAYVSAISPAAPFDGKLEASVTLSPTGKWTFA
jgi:predicted secreted protein